MEDSRIRANVPLWRKYSLSIQEAAEYYGIGDVFDRLFQKTEVLILY